MIMKKPKKTDSAKLPAKARNGNLHKPPERREGIVETSTVVEMVLPFMYASKSAEYVFGHEAGDGFITLSIPKDRFVKEPGGVLVKVEVVKP
jgi:hypothetical protein